MHNTHKMTPEEIRLKIIESTKAIGMRKNLQHAANGSALVEGDPVLVKTTLQIKIRPDG